MSDPDNSPTFFTFESQDYRIPQPEYGCHTIKLPDGRFLDVDGWLESRPLQPGPLTVVAEPRPGPVLEAVAVNQKWVDWE